MWQLVCRYFEVMDRAHKLRSFLKTGADCFQHPKGQGYPHIWILETTCVLLQKNEQPQSSTPSLSTIAPPPPPKSASLLWPIVPGLVLGSYGKWGPRNALQGAPVCSCRG